MLGLIETTDADEFRTAPVGGDGGWAFSLQRHVYMSVRRHVLRNVAELGCLSSSFFESDSSIPRLVELPGRQGTGLGSVLGG